jgi:hypothetical protein
LYQRRESFEVVEERRWVSIDLGLERLDRLLSEQLLILRTLSQSLGIDERALVAIFTVLTAGEVLNYHPHLHGLLADGYWKDDIVSYTTKDGAAHACLAVAYGPDVRHQHRLAHRNHRDRHNPQRNPASVTIGTKKRHAIIISGEGARQTDHHSPFSTRTFRAKNRGHQNHRNQEAASGRN